MLHTFLSTNSLPPSLHPARLDPPSQTSKPDFARYKAKECSFPPHKKDSESCINACISRTAGRPDVPVLLPLVLLLMIVAGIAAEAADEEEEEKEEETEEEEEEVKLREKNEEAEDGVCCCPPRPPPAGFENPRRPLPDPASPPPLTISAPPATPPSLVPLLVG